MVQCLTFARVMLLRVTVSSCVPHGAFIRLEPYTVKVVRTVLRGRGGGDVTLLPGLRQSQDWGNVVYWGFVDYENTGSLE